MPFSVLRTGQRVGHYLLEERIGVGGMGEVWKGRHELLARPVAIKSIAPHLAFDPQFASRFRLEAKAQAALVHPRIVSVNDFFSVPEGFFLVMPLISGESLERRLERVHPLPVSDAFAIAVDILGALEYAHGKGVIHRDVKPSNILVDTQGHGYLTDFGIALMIGQQRLTQTGASIGTPHYMSPEQILRPRQLDHRTDIYSFGCVLFEMLAGRPPFDVTTEGVDADFVVKEAHLRTPAPSPRAFNPALPHSLELVILRALAKQPEDRYQTCGAFASALTSAALEPIGTATTVVLPAVRAAMTPNAAGPAPQESTPSSPEPRPPVPTEPVLPYVAEAVQPAPATRPSRRSSASSVFVLALLAAPLLVALGLLVLWALPASRLTVGLEGADERSLGAALARVRTGGTITVFPGVYRESVRIERDVELVAEGARAEVVIDGRSAPAVTLKSHRATLRGLTLRTLGEAGNAPAAAVLVQAGEPLLEDCTITGSGEAAARLEGTSLATLRRCRVESVDMGDAMVVEGQARALLEGCEVTGARNGVVVRQDAAATLRAGAVSACPAAGVQVLTRGLAILDGWRIERCGQTGIDIGGGGKLHMRLGTVRGGHGVGLLVREQAEAAVESTEIADNDGHGVDVVGAQAKLVGCTIRSNGGRGVWAREGATVIIEQSTLTGNVRGQQLADRSSTIRKQ
ncbi:MAG: protein kinase [Thermoanaerobaculaceae bacterium]|nr:protein kinase [Thermoanaerobaculaceae bacterium]MDI9621931.1 protein kinase [Acidobacteriota bacterium]HPW56448.1 protein kinase [Thermoanaerobaculaceae bacterium]